MPEIARALHFYRQKTAIENELHSKTDADAETEIHLLLNAEEYVAVHAMKASGNKVNVTEQSTMPTGPTVSLDYNPD